jgi:hypothetical protein
MKPDISTLTGQKTATKAGLAALLAMAACFTPMTLSQYPEERLVGFAAMALFGSPSVALAWIVSEMSKRQKWVASGSIGAGPKPLVLGWMVGKAAIVAGLGTAGTLFFLAGYLYPYWRFESARSNPFSAMALGVALDALAVVSFGWMVAGMTKARTQPTPER